MCSRSDMLSSGRCRRRRYSRYVRPLPPSPSPLTGSLTHSLTHSLAHSLTHSPTQSILRALSAEFGDVRVDLLQTVAVKALGHGRYHCRKRAEYTRAMREADDADEDAQRARVGQLAVGGDLPPLPVPEGGGVSPQHRERIRRTLLASLAARVPSERYFFDFSLQTPAAQEKIVEIACAEAPGSDREKVKEYVIQALKDSRKNCRRQPNYTQAMRLADERAEEVQRARLRKAPLVEDAGTEEDDAVPQPMRASPSAGRPITLDHGDRQRGKKRALESHGRDGGGARAPVAKKALLQPITAAPAGPSPRSPTASTGEADTPSGDVGRAPDACPSSEVAGGILGAVDAFLDAEGTILADQFKERLRGVIRAAAARERTSRAELAKRVSERLKEAMVALVEGAQ